MISVSTWQSPLPSHASGTIVNYGDPQLVRDQADYRGYDLTGYTSGIAVMSPVDLGKAFWLRVNGAWYGPFLAVDTSRRDDFCASAGYRREIAEVPRNIFEQMTRECCIEEAEILAYGERPDMATDYREAIEWRYVPEGEYEPSPRAFVSPKQRVRFSVSVLRSILRYQEY